MNTQNILWTDTVRNFLIYKSRYNGVLGMKFIMTLERIKNKKLFESTNPLTVFSLISFFGGNL